jgi:hypothetical protein
MSVRRLALVLACVTALSGCQMSGDQDHANAPSPVLAPNTSPAPLPVASAPEWTPPLITTDDLNRRLKAHENLVVFDVRAASSWEAEHIEGSKSLPWADVEKRHGELPKDRPIVLYCA